MSVVAIPRAPPELPDPSPCKECEIEKEHSKHLFRYENNGTCHAFHHHLVLLQNTLCKRNTHVGSSRAVYILGNSLRCCTTPAITYFLPTVPLFALDTNAHPLLVSKSTPQVRACGRGWPQPTTALRHCYVIFAGNLLGLLFCSKIFRDVRYNFFG